MIIDARTHVRIARPSRDLAAAERFYVDGRGSTCSGEHRAREPGEQDLLMVGPAGGGWHFELTRDPEHPVQPAPTVEDLFVVYLGAPVEERQRAAARGRRDARLPAHNPYWDEYGVTVADPDGYQPRPLLPHLGLTPQAASSRSGWRTARRTTNFASLGDESLLPKMRRSFTW